MVWKEERNLAALGNEREKKKKEKKTLVGIRRLETPLLTNTSTSIVLSTGSSNRLSEFKWQCIVFT